MNFEQYSAVLFSAFKSNPRPSEVISKKQEILDSVYLFHNMTPASTLFVGFNPAIMLATGSISITAVDSQVLDFLTENKISYTYIDTAQLFSHKKKFDSVVAFDEFFTFAATDYEQQNLIQTICNCARDVVISTVKDYKNQDFKDREFSHPAVIRNSGENKIYLEFYDWDQKDRASWKSYCYEISNPAGETVTYGPFVRRTMYFKQLAKFSMDAGATHFQVHKNVMYKSLVKKNYEHVVSIIFE